MIINIYKPVDWTSFDVVKKIRGIVKEKKVGHAGTLDPFAEGVLVIGTGRDTKRLASISDTHKSYRGKLILGVETNTLDSEGKIVSEASIPALSKSIIENILKLFTGAQTQIPPMFSAKKIGGKKLYELARKNIEIEREPINILIDDLNLLSFDENSIDFEVTCSKGTYVRVLGKDIAEALGTVGHLSKLLRLTVGEYKVEQSKTIPEFEAEWKSISA